MDVDEPRWLRPCPGLCLVAGELAGLPGSGGIGTYYLELAALLASDGWRVHVLYCGPACEAGALRAVSEKLAGAGCSFSCLDAHEPPAELRLPACAEPWFLHRSDCVYHALADLDRLHHFDVIEFADYHGLGFRSVQARRAGLAFADARMIVKLHSPSAWCRHANGVWMTHSDELILDFAERYAFEHADIQLAASAYVRDYVRGLGWRIKEEARVVPNPCAASATQSPAAVGEHPEVVFFGRLETRKGLELFVEAVRQLDPGVPIRFVGRETMLSGGTPAGAYIEQALAGRALVLHTQWDREQALRYLQEGNRVAVIPSTLDVYPYTVVECATLGIPLLAAHAGGIPEVLPDAEVQRCVLFEPTAAALVRGLKEYLALPAAQRQELVRKAAEVVDAAGKLRAIRQVYRDMIGTGEAKRTCSNGLPAPARVSVGISYYNLGEFLPEALASLAAQTYANLEVIVVDDGSTSPLARRVFDEEQAKYPSFRFISQAHAGAGEARNRALREAGGEYFLPMDADNVALPGMIATLAAALGRNPDLSAWACYFTAFAEKGTGLERELTYAYRPPGGPLVAGSWQNVFGDTNALFRTADLRSVGGFPVGCQAFGDWETFLRLQQAGYQTDVVPASLFLYRHRDNSLSRRTDPFRSHQGVLAELQRVEALPLADRVDLWNALVSLQRRSEALAHDQDAWRQHCEVLTRDRNQQRQECAELRKQVEALTQQGAELSAATRWLPVPANVAPTQLLRYRLVDRIDVQMQRSPRTRQAVKRLILRTWELWKYARRLAG